MHGNVFHFIITILLLIRAVRAQSQCDLTRGCFPEKFNVLENIANVPARTITVSSTCGEGGPDGTALYNNIKISDTNSYTCTASQVSADKMVDIDIENPQPTFWQSEQMLQVDSATVMRQYVVLNFTDEFLFYEISVKFAVPHDITPVDSVDARPAAWSVEKLLADGITWSPLRHYARNCGASFLNITRSTGFPSTELQCTEYDPPENGVFFDDDNWIDYYPGLLDVFRNRYKNDSTTANYFTTSAIRLLFLQPAVSGLATASYVSISDIVINVVCKCNGHADICSGPNNATCQCQHFTTGNQCDQCQPLYNNKPPTIGTTSSPGECQICSCNQHADSCEYVQDKDHGVCEACQNNTAGDFCDLCASGFYVNSTWASSGDIGQGGVYCLSCQCSQAGTIDSQPNTCNGSDGQCSCKANVELRDCSQCKDGFFGLDADKVQGCSQCSCNSDGTLGENILCDKTDGACLCRSNVEGTRCDTCKPLTYNFDRNNPDGCTPCDCDPGASSDLSCNVNSGQCTCLNNIGGRDCRTPADGFFVPKMDFIIIEPELFAASGSVVLRPGHGSADALVSGKGSVLLSSSADYQISFTSDFSGPMEMAMRFEVLAGSIFVFVRGTISLTGTGYECNGQTVADNQIWQISKLLPLQAPNTRDSGLILDVCLNSGSTYSISLSNSDAAYWIDSILFVPDLSSVKASLSGRIDENEIDNCRAEAISTLRQNRASCANIEYSVMSALLGGAVACSCSSGSVLDASCDPMTGDCNCRNGALPPKCEVCKTEFYSFSTTTGCTACDCHATGAEYQYCTDTGACHCLRNVVGNKCDACNETFYGLSTGQGCDQCQCDLTYSQNNNCEDTGQCLCKTGVDGQNCDACADGFFNLTPDGCTACQCEPLGSTEHSCNSATGECECLANVEGHSCNQCKNGFFGLGSWHPGGCIPCFCWENGDNCTFVENLSSQPIVSGLNGASFESWNAAQEDGEAVTVSQSAAILDGQTIYTLSISTPQNTTQDAYYVAPVNYHGDRSSAYGRHLRIVMATSTPQSPGAVPIRVVIEGLYADSAIAFTSQFDTSQSAQTFEILVQENDWVTLINTTTTQPATFKDIMSVLASVSALKIQAYSAEFQAWLFDLNSVSLDGVQQVQGGTINNVESCFCQEGFTGNHCQECADGYTRQTPNVDNPNDQCVPCQCNGHSEDPCNAVSGVCTCVHNTVGDHCDTCVTGYFGNATKGTADDCLPCACPGNVPLNAVNVFAQTCGLSAENYPVCIDCQQGHEGDRCQLCQEGFFGTPENASNAEGSCQPCACNGRADTCDTRTGQCIGCRENTAGHSCEICAPGYFGDAMNAGCEECVCNTFVGSNGQCNPTNGNCECLPNVTGILCHECVEGTFNLTAGQGCEPCGCSQDGSTSQVCDEDDGQCSCRNLVQGRQCNECQNSFWNINVNTGCDACDCNATGTAKNGDALIDTCELDSGQCQCAQPGITGRQCNVCSPVTRFNFEYVRLFYLGLFPDCILCGECFDSWGLIMDEIGREIDALYSRSARIWSKYNNQTAETIGTALNVTQENINTASESVARFREIAQDLQTLGDQFNQAIAHNDRVDRKTDLLSQTETALQTSFAVIEVLTASIELTTGATTTLDSLHQQMNELMAEIGDSVQRGDSSWAQIDSLSFVVASPQERERQLTQQADRSMRIAVLANTTLALAQLLYATSLQPGAVDSARVLANAAEEENEAMQTYATIETIGTNVAQNITVIEQALQSLATESETARANMLQAVIDLQEHMINASATQTRLSEVETMVQNFQDATSQAEETMTNAMLAVLENIAALNQAQSDLVMAQTKSNNILNTQIRSSSSLQTILDEIAQSDVSSADVEALNVNAQKALFQADEALTETQQALGLAREVKQEVELMEQDIRNAQNLYIQAQGIRGAAMAERDGIQAIIDRATSHTDQTQQDISSLTAAAQGVQDDVKTISACLTQAKVSVDTATSSANEADLRSQTATDAQQTLVQVMININDETSDQSSTQTLTTMTTAKTTLDRVVDEAEEVMNITNIEELLQDLVSQNNLIKSLEADIDDLSTEVSRLQVVLEESVGQNACSSNNDP